VRRRAWLLLGLLALAPACGGEPPSPEERIRATLEAAQEEAREHRAGALADRIAEDYADPTGRDKTALEGFLSYHFLRNRSVHLLVQVLDVRLRGEDEAVVEALVATAGRPIPDADALAAVRADLLRLDLALVRRDDQWLVSSAVWERALASDLL
jgi:hypothetical protein